MSVDRTCRTTSTAACRTTAPGSATPRIRAASPTRTGRTCTAATASGCSPTRPIRTTSTPSRRAATSAASTARRTSRATSSRWPATRKQAALQLEHADPRQPDAEGHDLHRRAVPLPLARPRRDLGAHLAGPDDQRSGEAEAGAVGRRHRRQLVGRDAHDDLLDQRVAEGRRTSIWVGTDDGNLQLTRDGGKTWTNVVGNVPGLPKNAWVSSVEASRFDAGTAYATFDRHTFGDMTPCVYRTTDLRQDVDAARRRADRRVRGYAHVVKEDLVNREPALRRHRARPLDLARRRRQWAQFKGGDFPSVAVRDLAIHPRDHDLVIATHGRGIWIVDDITPLRALTPAMLAKEAAFVPAKPRPAAMPARGGWVEGDAAFVGPNPPGEARDHLLPEEAPHLRRPEDRGARRGRQGRRHVPASKRRGLNRVDLVDAGQAAARAAAASAAWQAPAARACCPGTYTVRLTKDKQRLRDEARRRGRPAREAHARRSQGAVRPRHEALPVCSAT